jgi:hypothetical protein
MGTRVKKITGSSPAPKKFLLNKEVIKAKPKHCSEVSFQQENGTNVCQWYFRDDSSLWCPTGDLFYIETYGI